MKLLALNITTLPAGVPVAPPNVTVNPIDGDGHRVQITWDDNLDFETTEGFDIERKLGDGTWAFVGMASAESTSYTTPAELSLDSLSPHEFRVWAIGPGGSSVSETATGYTDYGNGIVYEWSFGDEMLFDDVTATWSSDPSVQYHNDSISLAVTNLPAHYGLSVLVNGWKGNLLEGAEINMTGLGETWPSSLNGGVSDGSWGVGGSVDHTDGSATVTITGSGWDESELAWWTVLGATVKIFRYRIDVGSEIIAVGDVEDVPVVVTRDPIDTRTTPPSGVVLNVTEYDSAIIEPQVMTTATDAEGVALLPVLGVAPGIGRLGIEAEHGGRADAPQQVERVRITGISRAPTVVGATNKARFVVVREFNIPVRHRTLTVTGGGEVVEAAMKNSTQLEFPHPEGTTNETGQVDLTLIAKKPGKVVLTISEPKSGATKEVTITVYKYKVSVELPAEIPIDTVADGRVHVRFPDEVGGGGAPGVAIAISSEVDDPAIAKFTLGAGDTSITGGGGTAIFHVKGLAVGATTLRLKLKNIDEVWDVPINIVE